MSNDQVPTLNKHLADILNPPTSSQTQELKERIFHSLITNEPANNIDHILKSAQKIVDWITS